MKRKTTKEQKVATASIPRENIIAPKGTKIVTQEDIDMKQQVITNHLYQVGNLVAGICSADLDGEYKEMQKAMFTSVIERSSDIIMAVVNNMTLEDGTIVINTNREIPFCETPDSILDTEKMRDSGLSPLSYKPANTPNVIVLDRHSLLEHNLVERSNTPITSEMLHRLKSKLNTIDDPKKAQGPIRIDMDEAENKKLPKNKNNENQMSTEASSLLDDYVEKYNKQIFANRSEAAKKGWVTRKNNIKKAKRNAKRRKNR
jgi:hypothetical protein